MILRQFMKLIRWQNLIIIAVAQILTAIALVPTVEPATIISSYRFLLLVVSTVIIAAGGYIINDYYDIKIDYINRPNRVVAGRYFSRRVILASHGITTFIGIIAGLFAGYSIGAVAFFAAGLLWLYSNQLKRLPIFGNLSIAFLTGLSVFVVYIFYLQSLFLISAYAIFAFVISVIREIIKDCEDIEGDRKFDCKTLPVVVGIRKTKIVIYISILLLLVFAGLLLHKEPTMIYILSGLVLMMSGLTYLVIKADTVAHFSSLSQTCKVIMVIGMLSMFLFK